MALATGDVQPFLRASGLSVRYGPVVALDGVDLELYPGEIVALAGENGAGKSTLVRCIAGDITPDGGQVQVHGHGLGPNPRSAARLGVAVVWQDLALCDNLDIASNLLLGRESRRLMWSETRFHARAAALLADLGIDLPSTGTPASALSGGQRQLLAVARAMRDRPDLLVLDEPTASLGVAESARVEELAGTLPAQGTSVLMITHDVEQMFRLADRILVMRRGRMVTTVRPEDSHPDEVAALLSGQGVDVSARRQLNRLHSLADQLASSAPSSSLTLIMSALAAALGIDQLCVHVAEGAKLRLVGSLGLHPRLVTALETLPGTTAGGQVGRAAAGGRTVVSHDVAADPAWGRLRLEARLAQVASSWSVPFTGASGDSGVVTVMRPTPGEPSRDDLDLVSLYAGYAASALERDRLLGEVTSRNTVLETIRDVLQALAGPAPPESGLRAALRALQVGLRASAVALVHGDGAALSVRAWAGSGLDPAADGPGSIIDAARHAVAARAPGAGRIERVTSGPAGESVVAAFPAPGGTAALVSHWAATGAIAHPARQALIEDAANSFRLALEREESERAQREAMALRSSQELQRQFLSWLSHELRTPLTAIRGYASSLMQPDVDWDGTSQQRFLERISDESARLGRLVDDLLDFSAIDAGILRIHPDWCDLQLVLEAARACLPEPARPQVDISCDEDVAVVWADHDRLEQIFVNLLDNSVRHNPAGTKVAVRAQVDPTGALVVTVRDDGSGLPGEVAAGLPGKAAAGLPGKAAAGPPGEAAASPPGKAAASPPGEAAASPPGEAAASPPGKAAAGPPGVRPERRSRTGGAGLGLSIARGIVAAHGGHLEIDGTGPGTLCRVVLPAALGSPTDAGADPERVSSR